MKRTGFRSTRRLLLAFAGLFFAALMLLSACGTIRGSAGPERPAVTSSPVSEAAGPEQTTEAAASEQQKTSSPDHASAQPDGSGVNDPAAPDEDGIYDSKEDVALYLHIYGHLPYNYITKAEARKLGWSGGSVEEYVENGVIGGDRFGNYEKLLPEDRKYRECDIDTLGRSSRGAKRLIYSDDGYIYYTGDHYESFELLYEGR